MLLIRHFLHSGNESTIEIAESTSKIQHLYYWMFYGFVPILLFVVRLCNVNPTTILNKIAFVAKLYFCVALLISNFHCQQEYSKNYGCICMKFCFKKCFSTFGVICVWIQKFSSLFFNNAKYGIYQ